MTTFVVSASLTLSLYESIKDLPASLYQLARQFEVMGAELGGSEDEQNQMLYRAENYAVTGKLEEFSEQMRNYRLARQLTKDKFQASQVEWAHYIYSENGVRLSDYSEDALVAKIDQWSEMGLTQAMIEDMLIEVKKNSQVS